MMKTTKPLSRIAVILLCAALTVCVCACGTRRTPEESVRKELIKELRWTHGLCMEKCEISEINVKVVTPELLKEDRWLAYDGVRENDVVFDVTYDIKAWDFLPVDWLCVANGEYHGHWVRNAYYCGYLKCISPGHYELLSIGTGF